MTVYIYVHVNNVRTYVPALFTHGQAGCLEIQYIHTLQLTHRHSPSSKHTHPQTQTHTLTHIYLHRHYTS